MISELETEYIKLRKKYPSLPNYQILDKEFEIEAHMPEREVPSNYTSRAISNSVSNYLSIFIEYLHNLIFPNPSSLIIMEESKIYSEDEKQIIEDLLKKIVQITRKNLILSVDKDEKEDAKFITKSVSEWKVIKKKLLKILEKSEKHWRT